MASKNELMIWVFEIEGKLVFVNGIGWYLTNQGLKCKLSLTSHHLDFSSYQRSRESIKTSTLWFTDSLKLKWTQTFKIDSLHRKWITSSKHDSDPNRILMRYWILPFILKWIVWNETNASNVRKVAILLSVHIKGPGSWVWKNSLIHWVTDLNESRLWKCQEKSQLQSFRIDSTLRKRFSSCKHDKQDLI